MSQLKKLIEEVQHSKHVEDLHEQTMVSITVRIESQHIFKVDYLAKLGGLSRSRMATELLISAAMDGMTELGFDDDEQFQMFIESQKTESEVE